MFGSSLDNDCEDNEREIASTNICETERITNSQYSDSVRRDICL